MSYTEESLNTFDLWFGAQDLGQFEPVRDYMRMHALDNGEGSADVAIATVIYYLDDPEFALETFNVYM